jgi:hypothetical protein
MGDGNRVIVDGREYKGGQDIIQISKRLHSQCFSLSLY